MMGADMDLVLAINHVKSTLPFAVKCRHAYGNQDQNRKDTGVNTPAQKDKGVGNKVSIRDDM